MFDWGNEVILENMWHTINIWVWKDESSARAFKQSERALAASKWYLLHCIIRDLIFLKAFARSPVFCGICSLITNIKFSPLSKWSVTSWQNKTIPTSEKKYAEWNLYTETKELETKIVNNLNTGK